MNLLVRKRIFIRNHFFRSNAIVPEEIAIIGLIKTMNTITYEDGDLRTIPEGGNASKTLCGFLESDPLAIIFGI